MSFYQPGGQQTRSSPAFNTMPFNRPPGLAPPPQRYGSNPAVASPLHHSFPAYASSASAPGSPPPSATPSRVTRSSGHVSRAHDESRSSSVPSGLCVPKHQQDAPPTKEARRSVKHLTCFWWKEKGVCRFSEAECLYAHHDTGHYTDPPRQVVPGEPAKAGRALDRALRNLTVNPGHNPSASVTSMTASRPVTPGFEIPPAHTQSPPHGKAHKSPVQDDSVFLRNLVEQSGREKSVMVSTIETLQTETQALRATVHTLRQEMQKLTQERNHFYEILMSLQEQRSPSIAYRTSLTGRPTTSASNYRTSTLRGNFIGMSEQRRAESGEEVDESEMRDIFRNLGPSF